MPENIRSDRRLTEPAASLIGDNVQLHHVKYHAKPPEVGTPFPMHVDWFYFPHERETMTAYVICKSDAAQVVACLA